MLRITQHLKQMLVTHHHHQQQQEQLSPGTACADERPAKKHCSEVAAVTCTQGAVSCSSEFKQHVVNLLVESYQCLGRCQGGSDFTCQLEFCSMLSEVKELHRPLLQELLLTVQGQRRDEEQVSTCLATRA